VFFWFGLLMFNRHHRMVLLCCAVQLPAVRNCEHSAILRAKTEVILWVQQSKANIATS